MNTAFVFKCELFFVCIKSFIFPQMIYYSPGTNCLQKTSNYDIQIFMDSGCLPLSDIHLLHAKSSVLCMASKLPSPHWSTFLTRSTTGTDVQGIIPSSVMTISTKSGGVTSYTRLSRPSDGTFCQCSSCLVPARVTMRSSGSSEKD